MSNEEGVTAEPTVQDAVKNNSPEVDTVQKVETEAPPDDVQETEEEAELDYRSEYEKLKTEKLELETKTKRQQAANRATQERYEEAIAERKKLEQEILALKKPKEDDFNTQEDYEKAQNDYQDKLVDQRAELKAQEIEANRAQAAKFQQAAESFKEKEAAVMATDVNYQTNIDVVQEYINMIPKSADGTVLDAGFQEFSKFMALEAVNAPALLSHLGANPEKIEALLGKPPSLILKKLKAYEAELSVSTPPEPKPLPKPLSKTRGTTQARDLHSGDVLKNLGLKK